MWLCPDGWRMEKSMIMRRPRNAAIYIYIRTKEALRACAQHSISRKIRKYVCTFLFAAARNNDQFHFLFEIDTETHTRIKTIFRR